MRQPSFPKTDLTFPDDVFHTGMDQLKTAISCFRCEQNATTESVIQWLNHASLCKSCLGDFYAKYWDIEGAIVSQDKSVKRGINCSPRWLFERAQIVKETYSKLFSVDLFEDFLEDNDPSLELHLQTIADRFKDLTPKATINGAFFFLQGFLASQSTTAKQIWARIAIEKKFMECLPFVAQSELIVTVLQDEDISCLKNVFQKKNVFDRFHELWSKHHKSTASQLYGLVPFIVFLSLHDLIVTFSSVLKGTANEKDLEQLGHAWKDMSENLLTSEFELVFNSNDLEYYFRPFEGFIELIPLNDENEVLKGYGYWACVEAFSALDWVSDINIPAERAVDYFTNAIKYITKLQDFLKSFFIQRNFWFQLEPLTKQLDNPELIQDLAIIAYHRFDVCGEDFPPESIYHRALTALELLHNIQEKDSKYQDALQSFSNKIRQHPVMLAKFAEMSTENVVEKFLAQKSKQQTEQALNTFQKHLKSASENVYNALMKLGLFAFEHEDKIEPLLSELSANNLNISAPSSICYGPKGSDLKTITTLFEDFIDIEDGSPAPARLGSSAETANDWTKYWLAITKAGEEMIEHCLKIEATRKGFQLLENNLQDTWKKERQVFNEKAEGFFDNLFSYQDYFSFFANSCSMLLKKYPALPQGTFRQFLSDIGELENTKPVHSFYQKHFTAEDVDDVFDAIKSRFDDYSLPEQDYILEHTLAILTINDFIQNEVFIKEFSSEQLRDHLPILSSFDNVSKYIELGIPLLQIAENYFSIFVNRAGLEDFIFEKKSLEIIKRMEEISENLFFSLQQSADGSALVRFENCLSQNEFLEILKFRTTDENFSNIFSVDAFKLIDNDHREQFLVDTADSVLGIKEVEKVESLVETPIEDQFPIDKPLIDLGFTDHDENEKILSIESFFDNLEEKVGVSNVLKTVKEKISQSGVILRKHIQDVLCPTDLFMAKGACAAAGSDEKGTVPGVLITMHNNSIINIETISLQIYKRKLNSVNEKYVVKGALTKTSQEKIISIQETTIKWFFCLEKGDKKLINPFQIRSDQYNFSVSFKSSEEIIGTFHCILVQAIQT